MFGAARLFTTRYHKDTTMYHKDTTRYHKDTTRNLSFYHKDTPGVPRGTMRYLRGTKMTLQSTTRTSWSTLYCLYKVPQGNPRVLSHVYITYHKESLEYLAMSI
jgi:hypothetical protein